jgi:hypothetical protein
MPLTVRNGEALAVYYDPALSIGGPTPATRTMWIERLPARVTAISEDRAATIGRFVVYGVSLPMSPLSDARMDMQSETGDNAVPSGRLCLWSTDDPALFRRRSGSKSLGRCGASGSARLRSLWSRIQPRSPRTAGPSTHGRFAADV